jgi:hypothetical protein
MHYQIDYHSVVILVPGRGKDITRPWYIRWNVAAIPQKYCFEAKKLTKRIFLNHNPLFAILHNSLITNALRR